MRYSENDAKRLFLETAVETAAFLSLFVDGIVNILERSADGNDELNFGEKRNERRLDAILSALRSGTDEAEKLMETIRRLDEIIPKGTEEIGLIGLRATKTDEEPPLAPIMRLARASRDMNDVAETVAALAGVGIHPNNLVNVAAAANFSIKTSLANAIPSRTKLGSDGWRKSTEALLDAVETTERAEEIVTAILAECSIDSEGLESLGGPFDPELSAHEKTTVAAAMTALMEKRAHRKGRNA
jgi:hypothetical protein